MGIGLAALLAAAVSQAPPPAGPDPALEAYARPQRLIEVEPGRRLHILCRGEGSPTVILTAGLGQWSIAWSPVHSRIAETTRVCAWDRAGFGFSDASAEPQTLESTTGDLLRLLERAGIEGPYVLVGHSAGGFESMAFADRRPGEVAGMVLVNSTVPDQERLTREAAPAMAHYYRQVEAEQAAAMRQCIAGMRRGAPDPACFDYPPTWPETLKQALRRLDADPARFATALSLLDCYWSGAASRAMIDPRRNYGAMPLIVLTAGERVPLTGAPADAVAQYPALTASWYRTHDALAALSTHGVNRIVPGAGHSIQRHRPDAVVAAVLEVVEAARRRLARGAPAGSPRHFVGYLLDSDRHEGIGSFASSQIR